MIAKTEDNKRNPTVCMKAPDATQTENGRQHTIFNKSPLTSNNGSMCLSDRGKNVT